MQRDSVFSLLSNSKLVGDPSESLMGKGPSNHSSLASTRQPSLMQASVIVAPTKSALIVVLEEFAATPSTSIWRSAKGGDRNLRLLHHHCFSSDLL